MSRWFAQLAGLCAALGLFLMMTLTFVDVFGRYAVSSPVPGATEIISFLLAIVMYSGLPMVTHDGEHIAVGVLRKRFPRGIRRFEKAFTTVAIFGATAFIAYLTFDQAKVLRADQAITEDLGVPLAPLAFGLGIFVVAAGMIAARQTIHDLRNLDELAD